MLYQGIQVLPGDDLQSTAYLVFNVTPDQAMSGEIRLIDFVPGEKGNLRIIREGGQTIGSGSSGR